MTFFLRGRVKASSQRVSSPATEKHQDICTIPLAAFDPVSWLHRQGCSPSGKEKNCFNTPKAKSSKHPIFGVFFVWINFWKFPHLPIEIMESLVCQHFPFFFQMEKFQTGEAWVIFTRPPLASFGLDTVGPFRTLTGLLLRILAAFFHVFFGCWCFSKAVAIQWGMMQIGWNKNKTSDRYCTKAFSMNLQVIINLKIQWCSNRQLNLELWVRQMHPWTFSVVHNPSAWKNFAGETWGFLGPEKRSPVWSAKDGLDHTDFLDLWYLHVTYLRLCAWRRSLFFFPKKKQPVVQVFRKLPANTK